MKTEREWTGIPPEEVKSIQEQDKVYNDTVKQLAIDRIKSKRNLFYAVLFVFAIIASFYAYIGIHELVHVQIFTYFGCIDSEVHFELFKGEAHTKCNEYHEGYGHTEAEALAHGLHESISYTVFIMLVIVLCVGHLYKKMNEDWFK